MKEKSDVVKGKRWNKYFDEVKNKTEVISSLKSDEVTSAEVGKNLNYCFRVWS